jgi:CheY-like chemotaxis protein
MTSFILMAEDDPDVQLVAWLSLKKAGYRVEAVDNGRLLLERIRTLGADRPDIILLDWMMPDLDGPETCARLAADEATRDIPVIFMTSKAQDAAGRLGPAARAAGFIIKPIDPHGIGGQIRRILSTFEHTVPAVT